ncbi:MAG: uroporphyrinogen-III synthase [Alphaproteobacteria bacterium]
MRVLITRPIHDAERTQAALARRGIEAVVAPVIEIVFLPGPEPAFDGVQAIAVTSRNGVHALAARTARRDIPIYAVGKATKRAAEKAGFARIESADGDAEDLAALIATKLTPSAGTVLHAAGENRAGDLAGALARRGFDVTRTVLYRAAPVSALPQAVAAALAAGEVDGALFFSPRSASAFVNLVARAGLAGTCGALTAFCLSPAVAEAAAPLAWRHVAIAAKPNQAALIAAVTETME